MRDKLKPLKHTRHKFLGTFAAFGRAGKQLTILLHQVQTETEEFLTDHLWAPVDRALQKRGLQPGDTLLFEGRVKEYWHRQGRQRLEMDYSFGLVRVLKIYRVRGNGC